MAYDKFLIGFNDENSGFQTNVEPWLIGDNAFQQLNDCYILRGKVQKRFGSQYLGNSQLTTRLRLVTDWSYLAGVYSGTVPGVIFKVGQMFSVGNDTFTVTVTGTPGNLLCSNAATSGTFNTTTGAFVINGEAGGVDVFFYPSQPVMGLTQFFDDDTSIYHTIGFDTQFAYEFNGVSNGWSRLATELAAGDSIWTGEDYQFFWSTNYLGASSAASALWVTNFNVDDGVRVYTAAGVWEKPRLNYTVGDSIDTTDGSGNASGTVSGGVGFLGQVFTIPATTGGYTWFTVVIASGALVATSNAKGGPFGSGTFNIATGAYTFSSSSANMPIYFTGNNYIETSKIIVQFKNRLVLLNTIEAVEGVSTEFPFRCRFSAAGSALAAAAWMEDLPGNGGAIDAPTSQAIVTTQFVKDRLIIFFESSTYELAYTGNQITPFVWQKINNELGAVSTYSEVPFDKYTLGIDDNGIHACNGANVDRIDPKIPQYTFQISNEENGIDRVAGIRDYYNEMAYWTLTTANRNTTFYFPNQILVYNYVNESWSTITDSITTFGYFFFTPESIGLTWGQTTTPWGQNTNLWNSNASSSNTTTIKTVIAGNQQGFVFAVKTDVTSNASVLQITNFTVTANGQATVSCINHNLNANQYVLFSNMTGLTFTDSLGNVMPKLMARVTSSITLELANQFTINCLDNESEPIIITGTYLGGGTAQIVSNLNILTKQYNFYTEQDRNMYLAKVDFLVQSTPNGQVTADYLVSSSSLSLVNEGLRTVASPGPLPGNSTLETSPYTLYDFETQTFVPGFERFQARLWHPVYMWGDGECVQLSIYMTPNQMYGYSINIDPTTLIQTYDYVALNDFKLHAMNFYVTATSSRMQ